MYSKVDTAPVHHTFYSPSDLENMYKQLKIDPEQLNHNLDQQPATKHSPGSSESEQPSSLSKLSVSLSSDKKKSEDSSSGTTRLNFNLNKRPRPALKETGYTHFIHIPLWDSLRDFYSKDLLPLIQ
jgi:hypothetical protein